MSILFFKDFIKLVSREDENGQISWDNRGLMLLNSKDHEAMRLLTRVVHLPLLVPFAGDNDAFRIAENDILFVIAAGNVYSTATRDLWNKEHSFWKGDAVRLYNNALASFKTGKVIAATSATAVPGKRDPVPWEEVVRCGDIAEWCFTVLPQDYTSGSSARLAAMSFYLAQLYPTAEEIIETLNACAIDIGEPGIDREFGRGLANIICEPVFEKEYEVIRETLRTTVYSPALERIMKKEEKGDCACFSIFSKFSREMGIGVGHAGVSFFGENAAITLLAGRTFSPIGISSSLFSETSRFEEIGLRRSLFDVKGNQGSLVAVHSMQWGDLSANISRVGMLYEKHTGRYQAGVYAGYRHIRISAGLPGFRSAGANKVSLTRGSWEMRFSLSVGM